LFVRVRHGNLLGDGPHPIPALFVRYQLPESQDVGTAGTDAYWHDVLFLLLPSSLSSSPFGVIVAAVVLVAPAAVALAAFVAIDVSLVVDCCVLSPHEEDHRLPSPLGKVPSLPSSP
jgi:hypothetical protein